jgi:hypothetical protein
MSAVALPVAVTPTLPTTAPPPADLDLGEAPLSRLDALDVVSLLDGRRLARARDMDKLARYYDGVHDLPVLPPDVDATFLELRIRAQSPWMRLVVDAAAERLRVEGFRTSADRDADQIVWEWWQGNNMDAGSALVHTDAVKLGIDYVSVFPGPRIPKITGEHPCQCYVEFDIEEPERALYAVKLWSGGDGYGYATLYTPEWIYRFVTARPSPTWSAGRTYRVADSMGSAWAPRPGGPWPAPNTMGEVPFVDFVNSPTLDGGYSSDITPLISIQDRVNQTLFARLMAGEYGAFRQKWVTGLELERDDDGIPRAPDLDAAQDRIMVGEAPDTKFGEFGATDLSNYNSAIESDIQHICSISRTPAHYLLGSSGNFPSGESLKATETGLMARVYAKQLHFGESWERVVRLAGRAAGDDERANDTSAEVIWANTESRTMAELADSLLKEKSTIDTPREILAEKYGYTPTQIKRMVELWEANPDDITRLADAVRGGPAVPAPSPLVVPPS